MSISRRIKAARKAAGLSQEELARRAGMSLKGMGDIERGDIADPHYSSLSKIAGGLGVSVGELLGEPVPLGEAPEAGRSEVQAPEETDGARPNVEPLQEPSLLDDPQIVEWLREHGLTWGTTDDEAFSAHVRGLNLEGVDGDGRPVTVMELGRALTNEQDSARGLLRAQSKYRSLGSRLSVDPNAPVAEQKNQRHDQLRKLRMELNRRYRRRAYALKRYAELLTELLAAQKKSTTVSSIVELRRVANMFEERWNQAQDQACKEVA